MSIFYISTIFDTTATLYVGELLGISGCHAQGASFKEMLENLAQAMDLVASEHPEGVSVYFDLEYQDPEAMMRKSILVSALLDSLKNEKLDEAAAAALLGVTHQVFRKVLRGGFRDIPEKTLKEWLGKTTPGALLISAEVERENDGHWLSEVLELAVMACGQTPLGAVAAAIRSGAVTITNPDFEELLRFDHEIALRNEQFQEFTARLNSPAAPMADLDENSGQESEEEFLIRRNGVSDAELAARVRSAPDMGGSFLVELSTFMLKSVKRFHHQEGHYSRLNRDYPPKEHDLVELVVASPGGMPVGSVGTVVHVYPNGEAFEVEFNTHAGSSVETIASHACHTVTMVNSLLHRWKSALSQKVGRPKKSILEDGLVATDFPGTGVQIVFEDGSNLYFENAFHLGGVAKPAEGHGICQVAVFSEHVGYHEFWVGPEDQIEVVESASRIELTDREFSRLQVLLQRPVSRNKKFLQAQIARLENLLKNAEPDLHEGEFPRASVSHEDATIQELKDDPQQASTYLREVAVDGEPAELLQALRRMSAAFDMQDVMALTRDFRQTVVSRGERDPAFAIALLDEAKALFLGGESKVAMGVLKTLFATPAE